MTTTITIRRPDDTSAVVAVCGLKSGLDPSFVREDIQDTVRAHCCLDGDVPLKLQIKVDEDEWIPASVGVLLQALDGVKSVEVRLAESTPLLGTIHQRSEGETPDSAPKRIKQESSSPPNPPDYKRKGDVQELSSQQEPASGKKKKPANYPQQAVLAALKRECLGVGHREYVDENGLKSKLFLRK